MILKNHQWVTPRVVGHYDIGLVYISLDDREFPFFRIVC